MKPQNMSDTDLVENIRPNKAHNRGFFGLADSHEHFYLQEDVICRKFETISVSDRAYNS